MKQRSGGAGPCRLLVHFWLIKPVLNRHVRLQRLQLKVWSEPWWHRVLVHIPEFLVLDGSFQKRRQHDWWWDSFQLGWTIGNGRCDRHQRIFSSNRYYDILLSWWLAESSPLCMILSRRWFPILETCPALGS